MSRDFEFLKNIIELIPAVVSLLGLIGAGTIRRVGGKLVTNDPWAVFIHQLKKQTKIPTRHLVGIAMDLYSKMTPEMKDNLIRYHKVSPEIIRQIEERFQEYTRSNLPPLMRQEELAWKLRQIDLKDLPIAQENLHHDFSTKGYQWTQHVLPDGRVIWKLEPIKIRGLIPEYVLPIPQVLQLANEVNKTPEPPPPPLPQQIPPSSKFPKVNLRKTGNLYRLMKKEQERKEREKIILSLEKKFNETLDQNTQRDLLELARIKGSIRTKLRKFRYEPQTEECERLKELYNLFKPYLESTVRSLPPPS